MDSELAGLLEDLAGIDPNLDAILAHLAQLATAKPQPSQLQTVLYRLAGNQGLDLISVIGLTVRHLTRTSPAVDTLPDPARKTALEAGERAEFTAYYYDRTPVTEAIAALDHAEGGDQ